MTLYWPGKTATSASVLHRTHTIDDKRKWSGFTRSRVVWILSDRQKTERLSKIVTQLLCFFYKKTSLDSKVTNLKQLRCKVFLEGHTVYLSLSVQECSNLTMRVNEPKHDIYIDSFLPVLLTCYTQECRFMRLCKSGICTPWLCTGTI